MTYNSRRNLLGAISVSGKTAYHLFDIEYDGYRKNIKGRLLRKSKWPVACDTKSNIKAIFERQVLINSIIDNFITDIDFDPNGLLAATTDYQGNWIISDLNTGCANFNLKTEQIGGNMLGWVTQTKNAS